jgi:hypothetical protein
VLKSGSGAKGRIAGFGDSAIDSGALPVLERAIELVDKLSVD